MTARAEHTSRPESVANDARDRRRFRGPVQQHAICRWCQQVFVYERHIGRPRRYCTVACLRVASEAGR